jgi:DNA repair protein RecO
MKDDNHTAIIVGHLDFAEEDRIVRLLTEEYGLVSAIAKRARSSHRHFGGSIDVGNEVSASMIPGKGELWKLKSADIIEGRYLIRKNIHKIALMMYMSEVSGLLSVPNEADPMIFGLLKASLNLLGNIAVPSEAFHIGFMIKALTFAGIRPRLGTCLHCQKPFYEQSKIYFDPLLAGARHAHCNEAHPRETLSGKATTVSTEWLNTVLEILHGPLADSINREVAQPHWILSSILEHHIEKPLRSKSFLQSLYP